MTLSRVYTSPLVETLARSSSSKKLGPKRLVFNYTIDADVPPRSGQPAPLFTRFGRMYSRPAATLSFKVVLS